MTISNEAIEAATEAHLAHMAKVGFWEAKGSMRAALEAAAGIVRAECLEEAAAAWDTRTATLLETMKGIAGSRDYTHEDIIRYGAYSAEAQTTAARLRARAVAERGRQ